MENITKKKVKKRLRGTPIVLPKEVPNRQEDVIYFHRTRGFKDKAYMIKEEEDWGLRLRYAACWVTKIFS